jgi:hypothetical protein
MFIKADQHSLNSDLTFGKNSLEIKEAFAHVALSSDCTPEVLLNIITVLNSFILQL